MSHPNSKKITILRKGTFAESVQTNAMDFMSMSKKSIGSYWESKNAKGVGSGLSFAEKDLLMPRLVDIPKDDRTFLDAVRKFFEAMVTPVPYEDGLSLEIGLEVDNNEPVTFVDKDGNKNVPIALMDYIRYRHALGHPRVAPSLSTAKGNMLVEFYIFDPTMALAEDVHTSKRKDEALQAYFKIKDNIEKVDAMLIVLGVDIREFTGVGKDAKKVEELRSIADKRYEVFLSEYDGKMFEEKYLLTGMLTVGVVRRVGNQFINAETNKIIGNSQEEAMYFFKDPANSDQIVFLKSALQDHLKKEVKTKRKDRLPLGRP